MRALIESFVKLLKLVSELPENLFLVLLVGLLSPSALLIKFPESLFIYHERNDHFPLRSIRNATEHIPTLMTQFSVN